MRIPRGGSSVTVIALNRVTKRYGDRDVLRGVELNLAEGTAVTVEGANGSGKSTLLRILAGISLPTSGGVTGLPRRVAYLPERFSAPALMRADAYLRHLGRIAGGDAAGVARRAELITRMLDVQPGPHERLGRLSKGNLQKIGIAQTFAAGHRLVVLDEPRSGLESDAWPVLDELIRDHVGEGGIVVSAEHDPAVLRASPRRIRLAAGTIAPPVSTGSRYRVVVEREGEETSIEVSDEERDDTLRQLLDDGWSVHEVLRLTRG
jgi:ABC-type multidrug transport system ATPase subunit